jgi:hypothetical protein
VPGLSKANRALPPEEEFFFMKEDLKRVKAVLREKLGVSLYYLSGHPKTGQRWSGQNRPTKEAGD